MNDLIINELLKLERKLNIKILYAVESGSRAWGFASKDSDWDVRFIYIHNPEWYYQIDPVKESWENILPNKIDLAGWDLKKALRLFRNSNPPLLEWLDSPIIYLKKSSLSDKLIRLTSEYFNPKACIYHYLHMAEGNYTAYLQKEKVITKKYLYVLRPILACDWIYNKNSKAPMEFNILSETCIKDVKVKTEINSLLERKLSGDELSEEPKNIQLNKFIIEKLLFYKEYVKSTSSNRQPDTEKLNNIFSEVIKEVWG